MKRIDPEGLRLPIKLDTATNGEHAPMPLDPISRESNRATMAKATTIARSLGLSRRGYLVTTCGAAAMLATMNDAFAAAGKTGGGYELPKEASVETAAADTVLKGDEFVFDVQLHAVNPKGTWRETESGMAWEKSLAGFTVAAGCSEPDKMTCLDQDHLFKDVFLDSDTTVAVLTSVPSAPDNSLTMEEMAEVQKLVEAAKGTGRLLLHGLCHPNFPGHIERMTELQRHYNLSAWKTYPQWGPDGRGYFLDEEPGIKMIEAARALGVKNIAIHKGIPLADLSIEHSTCRDIGIVARKYPDMNFLIYHSGFDHTFTEGPYSEKTARGVDTLVRSLRENGIAPGSNVYAELGSTWHSCMRDPDMASHVLGKIMLAVGENNVLWGTDSIWYGSPQDQIQAFRAFQVSPQWQDKYGYPALTPEIKRKIFGLNGARVYNLDAALIKQRAEVDDWGKTRAAYLPEQDPAFETYGPKSRREFLAFLRENGGSPH